MVSYFDTCDMGLLVSIGLQIGEVIGNRIQEGLLGLRQGLGKFAGVGLCGEHGGDPMSVEFCHKIGLDYVSCSPFRVPIARLAAAQAAIKDGRN